MIQSLPWRLWRAQIAAILRLEIKKNFWARRAIPVYLLAAAPAVLYGIHLLALWQGLSRCSGRGDAMVYAGMFQFYYLRLGIFFGCVFVFMNLFRGEVLEKSLHYYFLAPVRRELLVVGKYLSGLVTGVALFGGGAALSFLILVPHIAAFRNQSLFATEAPAHLLAYTGVAVLAVAGYGAVFLFMGLIFRNPIIAAVVVLIWESINAFLPPLLKKISVIFYLDALCPVEITQRGRIFALTVDPPPAGVAIPGLLLLSLALVALSSLRIRRMEISYGTE